MNIMAPVRIDPLAQLSLGLHLPPDATFEDWSDVGRQLARGARAINWLIGDWIIAGERFGERARDEANAIFRSDAERFDPIVKTCRRFPEPKRHEALTFTHHQAVVSLEEVDADRLLSEAERDGMTTAMLRAQVKVIGGQKHIPLEDDDPEDTQYRGGVQFLNRLSKRVRQLVIEAFVEAKCEVVDL